jgi:hypothetical protein
MDVAQALNDYNTSLAIENITPQEDIRSPVTESAPEPAVRLKALPSLERRRSSYDRFSVVSVMPPLKEEATPHGTPVGTLTRSPDALSHDTMVQHSRIKPEENGRKDVVYFGQFAKRLM